MAVSLGARGGAVNEDEGRRRSGHGSAFASPSDQAEKSSSDWRSARAAAILLLGEPL